MKKIVSLCLLSFLLSIAAVSNSHAASFKWTLNDVSVFIPVKSAFLLPQDQGAHGPLFPHSLFDEFQPLERIRSVYPNEAPRQAERSLDLLYKNAVATGIRLDPCFIDPATGPMKCHRQVRIVWAPNASEVFEGYHAFYELDEKEFTALVAEWSQLNHGFGDLDAALPIQKNPRLADPKYAFALKSLLLKYIGIDNLVRFDISIFSVELSRNYNNAFDWVFAGIQKVNGKFQRMEIAGTGGARTQVFEAEEVTISGTAKPDGSSDGGFAAVMIPELADSSPIPDFAFGSFQFPVQNTPAVYRKFTQIENPRTFNVLQVDCLSCHIASGGKAALKNSAPSMKDAFLGIEKSEAFATTWPTRSSSFDQFAGISVMMFNGDSISQRVVNESAMVADEMADFMARYSSPSTPR